MVQKLNVVFSAHHASPVFLEYQSVCALMTDQLRNRYSDYYSGSTVPCEKRFFTHKSKYSRGVADLNRPLSGDPTLQYSFDSTIFPIQDFSRPVPHPIWLDGQEPDRNERYTNVYIPYHAEILKSVRSFDGPGIVIAWDSSSSPDGTIGQSGADLVLSNFAAPRPDIGLNSIDQLYTCDMQLLVAVKTELQKALQKRSLPHNISLNDYEKHTTLQERHEECGGIANTYTTVRNPDLDISHPLHAFQVEYAANTYAADYKMLQPYDEKINQLREAMTEAIDQAYAGLRTQGAILPPEFLS